MIVIILYSDVGTDKNVLSFTSCISDLLAVMMSFRY